MKSCSVYVEADGDRSIVVAHFNHDALTVEIPGTAVVLTRERRRDFGAAVLEALNGCVWQSHFNYRNSKPSDWPAYQASRERSMAQFERRWRRLYVRGATKANIVWVIEAPLKPRYSLGLTASVGQVTDPDALGAALDLFIEEFERLRDA